MDHRVDPGENARVGIVWIPLSLKAAGCRVTHQPDNPMTAGAQEGGQRRADQAG